MSEFTGQPGRWAVIATLCVASVAAAGPQLSGLFKGDLGQIEFSTEDGYVSGRYLGGGPCAFADHRRVFDGQLEGNVLVGRVLVCQSGAECEDAFYDVLAFYDPADQTLVGDVSLEGGCHSPALTDDRRLRLKAEEGKRSVRMTPATAKRLESEGNPPLKLAHQLMLSGKYAEARHNYLLGLSYQERNWAAYLGLGVAEIKLGHDVAAVDALERSKDLNPKFSDTYYNLACALARLGDKPRAMANLKIAVKLGGIDRPTIENEQDLAILRDSADWERVLQSAAGHGATANRRDEH